MPGFGAQWEEIWLLIIHDWACVMSTPIRLCVHLCVTVPVRLWCLYIHVYMYVCT